MGMKVGEERAITTSVGDTWWEPDSLRGVEVRADIELNELFEWELPEVRPLPACMSSHDRDTVHHTLETICWPTCWGVTAIRKRVT